MAVANNPYPQDVRVRQEAKTLTAIGFDVTVIAPKSTGQPTHECLEGIRVVRYALPPSVGGPLGYAVEFTYVTAATMALLTWIWLRSGLDVIHLHNPPDTLVFATVLPRLMGKLVVFDHHDLAPELYAAKYERTRRWIERLLRWLERLSCRWADAVITVNESYRRSDIERHGLEPERVIVVRNGPPLDRLAPVEPDPSVRRRAQFVVGYLGHIAKQDGVDHLLEALDQLESAYGISSWHAVVIGPADDADGLERLAEELGIAAKVEFTGFQPEPVWRAMLAATDVCVVPDPPNALNEQSTMIKIMDYMALGRPIVAYDLAEHRVSAADAALYAPAGDRVALAEAIVRLLRDPALRGRMGAIGRQRIEQSLAWEFSAQQLARLYTTLGAR